jgi:hypothetical protein
MFNLTLGQTLNTKIHKMTSSWTGNLPMVAPESFSFRAVAPEPTKNVAFVSLEDLYQRDV